MRMLTRGGLVALVLLEADQTGHPDGQPAGQLPHVDDSLRLRN